MLLKYVFGVLFYNHSTQLLPKMFDHLWVDPHQLSCPQDQGSDSGFLPVGVLVFVLTLLPLCTLFSDWDLSHKLGDKLDFNLQFGVFGVDCGMYQNDLKLNIFFNFLANF